MSQSEAELQLPPPPPLQGAVAEGAQGGEPRVTPMVDLYFEVARRYQLAPVAAVTIALRLEPVTHLRLDPASFGVADLLPLCEVLKVRRRREQRGTGRPRAAQGS